MAERKKKTLDYFEELGMKITPAKNVRASNPFEEKAEILLESMHIPEGITREEAFKECAKGYREAQDVAVDSLYDDHSPTITATTLQRTLDLLTKEGIIKNTLYADINFSKTDDIYKDRKGKLKDWVKQQDSRFISEDKIKERKNEWEARLEQDLKEGLHLIGFAIDKSKLKCGKSLFITENFIDTHITSKGMHLVDIKAFEEESLFSSFDDEKEDLVYLWQERSRAYDYLYLLAEKDGIDKKTLIPITRSLSLGNGNYRIDFPLFTGIVLYCNTEKLSVFTQTFITSLWDTKPSLFTDKPLKKKYDKKPTSIVAAGDKGMLYDNSPMGKGLTKLGRQDQVFISEGGRMPNGKYAKNTITLVSEYYYVDPITHKKIISVDDERQEKINFAYKVVLPRICTWIEDHTTEIEGKDGKSVKKIEPCYMKEFINAVLPYSPTPTKNQIEEITYALQDCENLYIDYIKGFETFEEAGYVNETQIALFNDLFHLPKDFASPSAESGRLLQFSRKIDEKGNRYLEFAANSITYTLSENIFNETIRIPFALQDYTKITYKDKKTGALHTLKWTMRNDLILVNLALRICNINEGKMNKKFVIDNFLKEECGILTTSNSRMERKRCVETILTILEAYKEITITKTNKKTKDKTFYKAIAGYKKEKDKKGSLRAIVIELDPNSPRQKKYNKQLVEDTKINNKAEKIQEL